MENIFKTKVYYKDTDAGGVVYHARYLEWLEIGRTELIADLGFSLAKLKEDKNLIFAVKKIICEYLSPALYGAEVIIKSRIIESTGATLTFEQEIINGQDQTPLVKAQVLLVAIDAKELRPRKIPPELKLAA